jgi:hypothetical protein
MTPGYQKPDPCWKFWQASQLALDNLNTAMQQIATVVSAEETTLLSPASVHEVKRNPARFQEQFTLLVREQKRKAARRC